MRHRNQRERRTHLEFHAADLKLTFRTYHQISPPVDMAGSIFPEQTLVTLPIWTRDFSILALVPHMHFNQLSLAGLCATRRGIETFDQQLIYQL